MQQFSVITPTGDRQKTFALCERYFYRQTIKPKRWIIVDDGEHPTKMSDNREDRNIVYVKRPHSNKPNYHTLPVQLLEAFKKVDTDIVIIMEDDDWYSPEYFERMMKEFEARPSCELIGQGEAVYYYAPTGFIRECHNTDRASFCQTAFRSSLIPELINICESSPDPFIDMRIWRGETYEKYMILKEKPYCIGIKGLPGRKGLTFGHTKPYLFVKDIKGIIDSVLGEDVFYYKEFLQ